MTFCGFGGDAHVLNQGDMLGNVEFELILNFLGHELNNLSVEIITTQMGVAISRKDLKDPVFEFQDRNIEGTATEIVHRNQSLLFLLQSVREGSGGRLVDDSRDVQPGNAARVFGSLPLCIVKICRNSDDGLGDGFSKKGLRTFFQFFQDHGGNFRRRKFVASNLNRHDAVLLGQRVGEVLQFMA